MIGEDIALSSPYSATEMFRVVRRFLEKILNKIVDNIAL